MGKGKVLTLEDRIPKLKAQRKQKANRRLITYLSFFFLLLIGIIYFQSPLNEIDEIEISGNHHISQQVIVDKLALPNKAKYWTTDIDKLQKKLESLNELQSVEIKRMFPNDLTINITEYERIGYIEKGGSYYPILDNGTILDSEDNKATMISEPVLLNWNDKQSLQMMAGELKVLSEGISNRISEIIYKPSETNPYSLVLYMNDGNEVRVTIPDFAKRMSYYPSLVQELASDEPMLINMTVSGWAREFTEPDKTSSNEQKEGISQDPEVEGDSEAIQEQENQEELD